MALRRRPVSRRSSNSLANIARRALLGLAAVAAVVLYAAAPAGAVNATLGSNSFGFEPRDGAAPSPTGHLTYHGGPVMHSNNTYAIYWDPPSPQAVAGTYDGDWRALIDGFLRDVGQDSHTLGNVYAVSGQYTDAGGHAAYDSTYRGSYTDASQYPGNGCNVGSVCLTDAQLRGELSSFISAHSLPTGMSTMFFLLTPPGVNVCMDSSGTDCASPNTATNFCSYHSYIGNQSAPGPSTVLYAVQPWTAGFAGLGVPYTGNTGLLASDCQDGTGVQEEPNQAINPSPDLDGDWDQGLADLIINEMSVEQMNIITNPLMNGWYDGANNSEQSDQCRDSFGGAPVGTPNPFTGAGTLANQLINSTHYYLANQFNLDAMKLDYPGIPCLGAVRLTADFTVPSVVNPGDQVGFDGYESLVDLGPATYSWDFGDGSAVATGPSIYHSFAAAGSYLVTLTATDQGGNTSTATRQITVTGTPSGGGGSTSGGGTTGGGTTGGSTTGGGTTTTTGSVTTVSTGSGGSHPGSGAGTGTPGGAAVAPAATAQILSRSLAGARRSGVTVSYSVNQAVAGRFVLMIDAASAKRLHIKGAHVAGGAAGSGGSVVVGSAILAAQRAGSSRMSIRFTKTAASHLAHARSLKITLKLTVATERGARKVIDVSTLLH